MPAVETSDGRLRGRATCDGHEFLGIPYAAAPRWAPPEAAVPWTGTREAISAGAAAPQPRRPVATFTHGPTPATAEQCLYLNVFTPSLEGTRPVVVWLHGGGFAIGHAAASLYDGSRLAREADVVVVTLNYRLGSLGWLGHPGLAAGPSEPSANWGLLDQIAALRWVRENAAAFGGDPARVTLAGQSAGALSAMDLLVVPSALGLFRRAVFQSPPLADVAQPATAAARWAEALSAAAGGSGRFDGARLGAAGAGAIVTLHEALLNDAAFRGGRGGALPTIDPATLPASPADVPASSPEVDVLIGHTAQEGTFFFRSPWRPAPAPERIPGVVAQLCHTDAPEAVLERYRESAASRGEPGDPLSVLVDIATDAMVATPLQRWAVARADQVGARSRVYRYRVDHPGAGPELRATHTVDVPLLFGTWRDGGAGQRFGGQAPGAEVVAETIWSAWARFIHDGDPGWPALEVGSEQPAVFGGLTSLASRAHG